MIKHVLIGLSKFWIFLKNHGYCSFSHAYDLKIKIAKKIFEFGHRFAPPHRSQSFALKIAIIRGFP